MFVDWWRRLFSSASAEGPKLVLGDGVGGVHRVITDVPSFPSEVDAHAALRLR